MRPGPWVNLLIGPARVHRSGTRALPGMSEVCYRLAWHIPGTLGPPRHIDRILELSCTICRCRDINCSQCVFSRLSYRKRELYIKLLCSACSSWKNIHFQKKDRPKRLILKIFRSKRKSIDEKFWDRKFSKFLRSQFSLKILMKMKNFRFFSI